MLFWCAGIQASAFSVDPLFCSTAVFFLLQLPVVSLPNFFRLNHFLSLKKRKERR
jgi:hypothetical protein